ncbi:MAG: hypothetical protein KC635_28065, partial [Myxococcales bacterium]|nr:hypothetical protein [Myxococcales bacterium]
MNLTRQELDDLLVDYLYDELDDARRAEFEAGVQAYPDLAAEVEAHQQTRSMARALPQVALPAGFLEGLMAQVEAAPAPAAPAPTPTRAAAASAKPAGLFARFASFFLQPNFAMAVSALVVAGVAALVIAKGAHQGDDADDQIVHGGASLSAAESPAERPVVVPPAPPAVAPALEE